MALCVIHNGKNGVCFILRNEAGVMLSREVGSAHVEVGVLAASSPDDFTIVFTDFEKRV